MLELNKSSADSSDVRLLVTKRHAPGALRILQFRIDVDSGVAHASVKTMHYQSQFNWPPNEVRKSSKQIQCRLGQLMESIKLPALRGRGTPPTNTVLRGSSGSVSSRTTSASDSFHGRICTGLSCRHQPKDSDSSTQLISGEKNNSKLCQSYLPFPADGGWLIDYLDRWRRDT